MSLAEELSEIETLFLSAHVSVSRELGLAPDTATSEAEEWFVSWVRELKSDPDLSLDLRAMVPVFYDVGRRKNKGVVVPRLVAPANHRVIRPTTPGNDSGSQWQAAARSSSNSLGCITRETAVSRHRRAIR